jgi:MFS family permease
MSTETEGVSGFVRADAKVRWTVRQWGMLIAVCGAFMLDALDNIMVGIALPPIQAEFAMTADSVQWIVSAYVLGFGGFLLLGGRLADQIGRRRMFLFGVAVFVVGSIVAGGAINGGMAIGGRLIMGVGAAFTAPAALSVITTSFPAGAARNRALGIYTACGAVGYSSGVIVGGLLTQLGWRWIYFLPLFPAAIAFAGGFFLVAKDDVISRTGSYDTWGALTGTFGVVSLVYAIVELPVRGLSSPHALVALALAAACLGSFVVIEKRVTDPLLNLRLLTNRNLVWASLVASAILGTYMSFQFIGTLYLQSTRGWSPLFMALAFLPIGLLIMAIAPRMGWFINKFGLNTMVTAGFVAYALAYANFLRIGPDSSYLWVILPSVALIGVAFPFSFPPANVLAVTDIAEDKHGIAAGVLQTGYQLGAAIVLAVTTALMHSDTRHLSLGQYHLGLWLLLGISLLVAALSMIVPRLSKRTQRDAWRQAPV